VQIPFARPEPLLLSEKARLRETLDARLAAERTLVLTQDFAPGPGLGAGTGKTALALDYAYRHAADYSAVFFVRNSDLLLQQIDIAAAATALRLPASIDRPVLSTTRAMHDWLAENSGWLLILDDLAPPDEHGPYVPAGQGHVLITSRHTSWERAFPTLVVPPLDPEAARALLQRGRPDLSEEEAAAISGALGHLPGWLHVAAGLLGAGTGPEALLHTLRAAFESSGDPGEARIALLQQALADLAEKDPQGDLLLKLCTFFSSSCLPFSALLPPVLRAAARDPLRVQGADTDEPNHALAALAEHLDLEATVRDLCRRGLATVGQGGLTLPAAVQAVARRRMAPPEQGLWADAALRVLGRLFPDGDGAGPEPFPPSLWPTCDALLEHGMQISRHAQVRGLAPLRNLFLLGKLARYLDARESPELAALALQRGQEVAATLPPEHPARGFSASMMGALLQQQGRFEEARACHEEALALAARTHGDQSMQAADAHQSLWRLAEDMGDLRAALPHAERALAIYAAKEGEDAVITRQTRAALAGILSRTGSLREARAQLEQAIQAEMAHAPGSPVLAGMLISQSEILLRLGELPAARRLMGQALPLAQRTCGERSREAATGFLIMGQICHAQGQHRTGALYLADAHLRLRRILGEDHPMTRSVLAMLERAKAGQSKQQTIPMREARI
jgi:tetratricopeptide (TPR) repeat protein